MVAVIVLFSVLIYRELFVTNTWHGQMQFQVTSVGSSAMWVVSVPGTAVSVDGSPPLTGDIADYIPLDPAVDVGDLLRCQVDQTFLANRDIDTGPHSTIRECALSR